MSTVVIDGPTRDKLLAASGEVVISDEAGILIGKFQKFTQMGKYIVDGEWPSDEELERRSREGRRYSAEEVIAQLRELEVGLTGR